MVEPEPDRWGGAVMVRVLWGDTDKFPTFKQMRYQARCIFCGEYAVTMRDLIDHFHREHGRVL